MSPEDKETAKTQENIEFSFQCLVVSKYLISLYHSTAEINVMKITVFLNLCIVLASFLQRGNLLQIIPFFLNITSFFLPGL